MTMKKGLFLGLLLSSSVAYASEVRIPLNASTMQSAEMCTQALCAGQTGAIIHFNQATVRLINQNLGNTIVLTLDGKPLLSSTLQSNMGGEMTMITKTKAQAERIIKLAGG